jgi:hypothetical protein
MTLRASLPAHDPRFDGFLFAPVGDDCNGTQVTVLSALARLDVDPRQEALELAGLPEEIACQRLDALIARLPGVPALVLDHLAVAEQLIARLPRLDAVRVSNGTAALSDMAARNRHVALIVFMVFLLLGQLTMLAHQPGTKDSAAKAPISSSGQTGEWRSHAGQ